MELQLKQQKQGHVDRLQEIQITADAIESKALYKTYSVGIKWVDALNGTVRPVLAYAFFLLYAAVKYAQIIILLDSLAMLEAFPHIWHSEDQTIFAGIISFYFGQRAFVKLR